MRSGHSQPRESWPCLLLVQLNSVICSILLLPSIMRVLCALRSVNQTNRAGQNPHQLLASRLCTAHNPVSVGLLDHTSVSQVDNDLQ